MELNFLSPRFSTNFFHGGVMIHNLWNILGAGFQLYFFSVKKPLLQTYEKADEITSASVL